MKIRPRSWLSPHGLLFVGVLILVVCLGLHLLGLRDEARVLSGTPAGTLSSLLGLVYVVAYFAALVVAPALLGGAALMLGVLLLLSQRGRT